MSIVYSLFGNKHYGGLQPILAMSISQQYNSTAQYQHIKLRGGKNWS